MACLCLLVWLSYQCHVASRLRRASKQWEARLAISHQRLGLDGSQAQFLYTWNFTRYVLYDSACCIVGWKTNKRNKRKESAGSDDKMEVNMSKVISFRVSRLARRSTWAWRLFPATDGPGAIVHHLFHERRPKELNEERLGQIFDRLVCFKTHNRSILKPRDVSAAVSLSSEGRRRGKLC